MKPTPIFLLLFLFFTGACSLQQEIEVALPTHTPVTFVECYLEPGAPARALVTQSVGYFDNVEVIAQDSLQLVLFHNDIPIHLTNEYLMDSAYMAGFNYLSTDTVHFSETDRWELVVLRDEQELARGEAHFLPKVKIKEVVHTVDADSMISLVLQLEDDPAQENYYRVVAHPINVAPRHVGYSSLWNDQTASDGILEIKTGPALPVAEAPVVAINVYHINKAYYEFLESLRKAYDANYNPFAQPATVVSNLEGEAEGIFTAVAVSRDTVVAIQH